jgi:NAD(P)-dependent dehydrogenase (short-subunit alcohol dehydrogenase family)
LALLLVSHERGVFTFRVASRSPSPSNISLDKVAMELLGKTALVTGAGTPGGIGAAIARQCVAQGATVLITDRNVEQGELVARDLSGPAGHARFISADLANMNDVQRLIADAGEVDILVHNAFAFYTLPTTQQEPVAFDHSWAVNVRAPFFLTAAIAPTMVAKGAGNIVIVGSIAARIALPGLSTYGAQKAAVESLARSWAAEFGPGGVRVNTVSVGPTASANTTTTIDTKSLAALAAGAPLRRLGSVDEVAEAVLFLAGPRSSIVTGSTLVADGGRTAV